MDNTNKNVLKQVFNKLINIIITYNNFILIWNYLFNF